MTSQLYGLRTTDSQKKSLPLVNVEAHTVILETTSRTTLTQTYQNPSASDPIPELQYTFPLYDGVSVVGFTCRIGDRTIIGQVKEKQRAKKDFKDAVLRGDKAALLEQLPSASDVFTTTVGNIPAGAKVVVEITYIGELKHDAEVNGVRFTIPTSIMPRY
ncbi:von Willebrand factor A domain-containing protein 5A, partial [Mortierella sp. NVP85]